MEISETTVTIPREVLVYGIPVLALVVAVLIGAWRVVRAMVSDLKDFTISNNTEMYARHHEVTNRSNLVLQRLTDESERISYIEFDIINIKNQLASNSSDSESGGHNDQ